MGKIKVTRPDLKNSFGNRIFCCGYCDLQYIMWHDARFYNCGVYGWNYDCYVNYDYNICITTGYRGMFGKRISVELIESYSKKAADISYKDADYAEKRKELENNFYMELIKLLRQ